MEGGTQIYSNQRMRVIVSKISSTYLDQNFIIQSIFNTKTNAYYDDIEF